MDNRNLHFRSTRTRGYGHDDAWGLFCVEIGGVTLAPQGFARREEEVDLLAQCAELNRQAILPPPEMLAGKSVKDIAAGVRW
jgi:hypothetical protein